MVAAFCVSGYASTYTRAGQKPFNPVLGETYECIREDKGWKFIAEQASFVARFILCYTIRLKMKQEREYRFIYCRI